MFLYITAKVYFPDDFTVAKAREVLRQDAHITITTRHLDSDRIGEINLIDVRERFRPSTTLPARKTAAGQASQKAQAVFDSMSGEEQQQLRQRLEAKSKA